MSDTHLPPPAHRHPRETRSCPTEPVHTVTARGEPHRLARPAPADEAPTRSWVPVPPGEPSPDEHWSSHTLRQARADYVAVHNPVERPPRRRWAVSRRVALAAAGAVALVAAAVGLRTGTSVADSPVALGTPSPPAAATAADVVVVHVVGAVTVPGVVSLPGGSRVADAIEAAGGATGEADLTGVNLARTLVDGEQLYVPRPGEVAPGAPGVVDDGRVDLNHATQGELETLPGVGPVLAGRIVAARPFTSVDSLERVSGIGPSTMARLRDLVKV